MLRDARAVNDKVRLLAKLGAALIKARDGGETCSAAVADRRRLGQAGARASPRPSAWRVRTRRTCRRSPPAPGRCCTGSGPLFLDAFQLRAVPAAAATLRAVEVAARRLRSGGRKLATQPADQLSPPGLARRGAGRAAPPSGASGRPPPCSRCATGCAPATSGSRAAGSGAPSRTSSSRPRCSPPCARPGRCPSPCRRPRRRTWPSAAPCWTGGSAEVAAKAAADALEDVRIKGDELKITPLKAATPEAAEALAERLYGMMPNVRITDLLAEVRPLDRLRGAFTHLHTGLPADDPRVVLTAVLADATNLGLTRMADACSVASYRQLAWTAGWHLREETYRRALAILVNAQQRQPLAALFGAADVSSSDGQHFPTGGPGEAVGAVNAHYGREASALLLHPCLGPPRAVPHRRHPALRRGGPRHRRPALPRGGPQHRRPPHRRRRRQRPRLRLGPPPRFPLRAAHPQPGRAPALRLRRGVHLAGAGAVHRRRADDEADRGALGRCAAARRLGAHRDASAPRSC